MNRTEKNEAVEVLASMFRSAPHVVLADFRGLTAGQATELRRRIRSAGGTYQVIKNRLARRGAEGTSVGRVADKLVGPCALAMHASDPIALPKVLTEFAKESGHLRLVAAVVDAKDVYEGAEIDALAALPSLPEVRAQLLALVNTPATQLVRLLGTPGTQMARAVDARREKLEGAS